MGGGIPKGGGSHEKSHKQTQAGTSTEGDGKYMESGKFRPPPPLSPKLTTKITVKHIQGKQPLVRVIRGGGGGG